MSEPVRLTPREANLAKLAAMRAWHRTNPQPTSTYPDTYRDGAMFATSDDAEDQQDAMIRHAHEVALAAKERAIAAGADEHAVEGAIVIALDEALDPTGRRAERGSE